MTNQSIPKRSEVPEEMTWNLKDMFESDQAWMAEYEAMKEFPAKIAAFQGTLARSAQDLLAWFRLQDEIELRQRAHGLRQLQGRRGYRQQLLSGCPRQGHERICVHRQRRRLRNT